MVHTAAGGGGQGGHPHQLECLPLLQTPAELPCIAEGQPHTPASPAYHVSTEF